MTRALAGKVTIPLTPVALGSWVLTFPDSLTVLFSDVMGFAPERPVGLTLEELEADLLGEGRVRLKLGLPVVAILELSLKSV